MCVFFYCNFFFLLDIDNPTCVFTVSFGIVIVLRRAHNCHKVLDGSGRTYVVWYVVQVKNEWDVSGEWSTQSQSICFAYIYIYPGTAVGGRVLGVKVSDRVFATRRVAGGDAVRRYLPLECLRHAEPKYFRDLHDSPQPSS